MGQALRPYWFWSLGGSSVAEAPEESMEMLSEPVDRETEILEENALTINVLPKGMLQQWRFYRPWLFPQWWHPYRLGTRRRELLMLC